MDNTKAKVMVADLPRQDAKLIKVTARSSGPVTPARGARLLNLNKLSHEDPDSKKTKRKLPTGALVKCRKVGAANKGVAKYRAAAKEKNEELVT